MAAAPRRPPKKKRRGLSADEALSEQSFAPQAEVPRGGLGTDRSRPEAGLTELSWASFDGHVQALARAIVRSFVPEAVVGVAHGGVFVGGALASALGADFYPVRISRRSRSPAASRKSPRLSGSMPRELKGRRVLIVDDVSASGETLKLAKRLALKAGARRMRTAALVSRPEAYAPDFSALVSDALVVFPWDYVPVTEDGRFEAPATLRGRARERR